MVLQLVVERRAVSSGKAQDAGAAGQHIQPEPTAAGRREADRHLLHAEVDMPSLCAGKRAFDHIRDLLSLIL